uniref:Protein Wnt n=1 Tax=Sycon ciliatum TaxID=27933 RepID=A0A077SQL9_9METZ|nr:Wnt F SciWntF [Sycon ciliatum]
MHLPLPLLATFAIIILAVSTVIGGQALLDSNSDDRALSTSQPPPALPGIAAYRGKLQWWSLSRLINDRTGRLKSASSVRACQRLPLSKRQKQLCTSRRSGYGPALVTIAARASLAAVRECQRQFQDRLWTCEHFEQGPLFGRAIKQKGSREAAFVHALMAASLAHEAVVACSRGNLEDCGCVRPQLPAPTQKDIEQYELTQFGQSGAPVAPRAGETHLDDKKLNISYVWSAKCFDNILYGMSKADEFVQKSSRYVKRRARQLMNLHNHQAGILTLKETKMKCQCLGVTSSCSFRVCWNEVEHFTKISKQLLQMYERAIPMKLVAIVDPEKLPPNVTGIPENSTEAQLAPAVLVKKLKVSQKDIRWELRPAQAGAAYPSAHELVYIDQSPDYCKRNDFLGVQGTGGRQCHRDDDFSPGSCSLLCCNRRVRTVTRVIRQSCHCKFVYCCRVECQTCTRQITEHFCADV